jgi:broad specificity phosphatase PhoE
MDVIARLEPVIFEIERQKQDIVIVSHQAVLRCLYAYFQDLPLEECPYISIPLHTVYVNYLRIGKKESRISCWLFGAEFASHQRHTDVTKKRLDC